MFVCTQVARNVAGINKFNIYNSAGNCVGGESYFAVII